MANKVEELAETIRTPEFKLHYIESQMKIVDKNSTTVPFKFNKVQRYFYQNKTSRNLILKAGQMGFTSCGMADQLADCLLLGNITSIVVAHEEFITQRLLEKSKFFEKSIDPAYKPEMHHKSAYEMSWDDVNSTFYIGSARSFVFGRGERIDRAWLSEFAFWQNPDQILKPLLVRAQYGTITIESTPNGEGNRFHDLWQEAREGERTGRTNWKPFFFPWWWNDEYRLPEGSPFALPIDRGEITPTEDEKHLMSLHPNLTIDHIRWRRWKLSELHGLFFQEYPEDEVSCFLPISDMVFDSDLLNAKAKECYEPPKVPNAPPNVKVWYPPNEVGYYIVGADPTVGCSEKSDKAAAVVWNIRDYSVAATLVGGFVPDVFAKKIMELGHWFNDAQLVIEANNSGISVLKEVQDARYPNVYAWRDLVSGRATGRMGWITSASSKDYIVSEFRKVLPTAKIHDIDLIRELRNLRFFGNVIDSITADDIAMAAMIGIAAKGTQPLTRGLVGRAGWDDNW